MEQQEYFDKTVAHMRRMPRQAIRVTDEGLSSCQYLTPGGNRCAVGWWIPDDHPALGVQATVETLALKFPDLNGVAWPKTDVKAVLADGGGFLHPEGRSGLHLARQLQQVHDHGGHWRPGGGPLSREGEHALRHVAQVFGLEYTPPAEMPPLEKRSIIEARGTAVAFNHQVIGTVAELTVPKAVPKVVLSDMAETIQAQAMSTAPKFTVSSF